MHFLLVNKHKSKSLDLLQTRRKRVDWSSDGLDVHFHRVELYIQRTLGHKEHRAIVKKNQLTRSWYAKASQAKYVQ